MGLWKFFQAQPENVLFGQFCDLREDWAFIFTDSFLTMALLLFSLRFCVTVCLCVFHRELGGETMLRETFRGALSAQWERYCLSDRGLCHHAAGMWHAGGGQNQQMHHIRLLPHDKRRRHHSQRNWGARFYTWTQVWMNFSLKKPKLCSITASEICTIPTVSITPLNAEGLTSWALNRPAKLSLVLKFQSFN